MAEKKLIELTSTGLSVATREEVKKYLKDVISAAYGSDINFNPAYPDGIFVEGLSKVIHDTFESVQGLYNSFNVKNSSGVMLDFLSSLVNIYRKPSTNATGILTINLSNDNPEDLTYEWSIFQVKDQNNNIWTNREYFNEKVPAGGKSINLLLTCELSGEVEEPNFFTHLSPVGILGLSYNNYLGDIIQGTFIEDDINLRTRVSNTPIYNSVSIKEQLIKTILSNKNVRRVKVYHNDGDKTINLKLRTSTGEDNAVKLPPTQITSIIQYVKDYLPSDAEKEIIAKTLFEYKGLCTITLNPEGQLKENDYFSCLFEDPQVPDHFHTVYYIEAQEKTDYMVNISIIKHTNYNQETTPDFVRQLVHDYADTLNIGENLVTGNLMNYLHENSDKQFYVSNLEVINGLNNDKYFGKSIIQEEGTEKSGITINVDGE